VGIWRVFRQLALFSTDPESLWLLNEGYQNK
jgi:hypothetical protein